MYGYWPNIYKAFLNQEIKPYVRQCYLRVILLHTNCASIPLFSHLICKDLWICKLEMDYCPQPLAYYIPHPFPLAIRNQIVCITLHIIGPWYAWWICDINNYAHHCTLPTGTCERSSAFMIPSVLQIQNSFEADSILLRGAYRR